MDGLKMDENKNTFKSRLSEQLPVHSPDPGSWNRLSAKLDAIDADKALYEKLDNLPLHSPDPGTWNAILFRLNRTTFRKRSYRIAVSVAAGLLLFFSVVRIAEVSSFHKPLVARAQQEQGGKPKSGISLNAESLPANANSKNTAAIKPEILKIQPQRQTSQKPAAKPADVAYDLSFEAEEIALNPDEPTPDAIAPDPFITKEVDYELVSRDNQILNSEIALKTAVLNTEMKNPVSSPAKKYYSPKEPKTSSSNHHFALGMNYLPENIDNGTDNSLFHNVDLSASYNKEKVRYTTSIGMAYNEEQLIFDMNYDIPTAVTAPGPGGSVDTVGYQLASVESQYQGTEQHQYFTYNLGIGRKLFSLGKFSSWITAGAGFGVRVNNPDLINSTANSIKGQYNALITSVESDQPVYNDVNVNFVTGLDFNYKILNKISISFAPTSRWYFKPVLTKGNQATDELTLGFKTGVRFDF